MLPIGLVWSFELLAEPSSTSGVTLVILLLIILFAELLRRRILHWRTTGLHNRFLSAEMASQLRAAHRVPAYRLPTRWADCHRQSRQV